MARGGTVDREGVKKTFGSSINSFSHSSIVAIETACVLSVFSDAETIASTLVLNLRAKYDPRRFSLTFDPLHMQKSCTLLPRLPHLENMALHRRRR